MRKWFGILGMLMVLAGCQDSTSDVAVVAHEELAAAPDTVIVSDGLTVEMYLPDNPLAIELDARLQANAGVQMGLDLMADEGFTRDGTAYYLRAVGVDGRALEATWFPVTDATGERVSLLGHVRTDTNEFVIPVRSLDPGEPAANVGLLARGKNGQWRPSTSSFESCLSFYQALFAACYGACIESGIKSDACYRSCRVTVMVAFVACIFFATADS
jgi:hypothetical protein